MKAVTPEAAPQPASSKPQSKPLSKAMPKAGPPPGRRLHLPLLGLGMLALLTGVWGGLTRVPINLPLPGGNATWLSFHGPLMVCGFLGTVIGLERAIGLPGRWPVLAPVLTAAGALTFVAGAPGRWGPLLLAAGSAVFVAVTGRVVQLRRELFTVMMSIGAGCWLVGNGLWLADWPLARVAPWWMAFLGLTIVGERLDLSRFQKPETLARPLFYGAVGLFLAGVGLTAWEAKAAWGERLTGAGLLALAIWLARFDIARRTVRQAGLPRFMAVCLLSGYVWMAVAGGLLIGWSPLQSGASYDAVLHAFFLGFVFAMIFAHAPVIFPAVLGRAGPLAYHPRFLLHLGLLQLSLVLRVTGAMAGWPGVRRWGAILNGLALAIFLVNTMTALWFKPSILLIEKR